METTLLRCLCDIIRTGRQVKGGFKEKNWTEAIGLIQPTITQTLPDGVTFRTVTQQQATNKNSDIKNIYAEWLALRDNSGFGWDAVHELFTAPDEVWKAWIKVSIVIFRKGSAYLFHSLIPRARAFDTRLSSTKSSVSSSIPKTWPPAVTPIVPARKRLPPPK